MKKILTIGCVALTALCFASPASNMLGARGQFQTEVEQGISARSYIQNGLICQWDGIENVRYGVHDESASQWIDLRQGVPIPYMSFVENYGVPTWKGVSGTDYRYYRFRIDRDFTMHGCLINPPRYWKNWTLIGIGRAAGVQNGITLCAKDGAMNYSVIYSSAYSGPVYAKVDTGTAVGDKYVVDIVFQYASKTFGVYVNGLCVGSASIPDDEWNLDDVTNLQVAIGCFHAPDNVGDFRVFDFLIYDRCLTAEEIEYNCLIDKERFGLP